MKIQSRARCTFIYIQFQIVVYDTELLMGLNNQPKKKELTCQKISDILGYLPIRLVSMN